MKHIVACIFLGVILSSNIMHAQVVADTFYVPNYPIPEIYYSDGAPELPENVWNHKLKYFPDSIVQQIGSTCGQASGIFNCMTYMFNRAYDREADSSNIFPPNYTYNQLSKYYGVSTFDSWNIVKSQGHPSQLEYETIEINPNIINPFSPFSNSTGKHFMQYWMNSYDNYYKSFSNRISEYYSLNLNTDEDLKLLKHFLNDGFEEYAKGGVAIFYLCPNYSIYINNPIHDTSLYIGNANIPYWVSVYNEIGNPNPPSHSFTLVGYYKNDSIDFNGDGFITDTLDINSDGIIDMHDNETILWIISGSDIHLLKYDVISQFWNQQVFFPIPDTAYSPELTFKLKIKHAERGDLKISAGISSDLKSERPEIEIDFPIFNFLGGDVCITGVDSLVEPDVLEFGIDITDLKNYISEPGTYKLFMRIENEGLTKAELLYASIIDYSNDQAVEKTLVNSSETLPTIYDNYYSEIFYLEPRDFNNHIQIINESTYTIEPNTPFSLNLGTIYGQSPFEFYILDTNAYLVELSEKDFPSDEGFVYDTIKSIEINPDWNIPFAKKNWDQIHLYSTGEIRFRNDTISDIELYPYQNTIHDKRKLDFMPFEIDKLYIKDRPVAINLTNEEIQVFIKNYFKIEDQEDEIKHESFIKISKDGVIEITYADTVPSYFIFANIKTDCNKYFIPYDISIAGTYNTVTFTPNPADSLFTIDENGILTMQAVSEPGKYETSVLVRDADGQEFTKRIEVNVINENIIGKLYPNPTKDILYCDIYNPTEQNTTIEIFTITGQCVYKETTLLPAGITEHNFNTTQFGQGVYLLKISMGDNSQTQRFVVTK